MKSLKIATLVLAALFVASPIVIAKHHTPEERGKALFNDPKLGGGTSGKSCGTCHPDGKGLAGVAHKKEWKNPGGTFTSLEETVNLCIEMALKGKALDVKSEQMKDIVSYIRSLKKPPVGC